MTLEKFREAIKENSDEDIKKLKIKFEREIQELENKIHALNSEECRRTKAKKEGE